MFLSNKEKSEKQAELFAQAIIYIGNKEYISSVNMWCHSKSGLLALRAFQKLKEKQNDNVENVIGKIRAVLTSMPAKGIEDTDRRSVIKKLDTNKLLKFMPFSGYIKTGILSFYDKYLYKPCPAQVDIKKPKKNNNENMLVVSKNKSKFAKFLDKIQGNNTYEKRVSMEKQVEYDSDYLERIMSEQNMESIKDIKYETLPVNIETDVALKSLLREGQIMPLILLLKKSITSNKQKGDGINTYEAQGIGNKEFEKRLKIQTEVVKGSHDLPTTTGAMKKIADELTKN